MGKSNNNLLGNANGKHGAIVGAGIAGLAMGLFAQQYEIDLPIFDRAPTEPENHHLIWLAPNGIKLLSELAVMYEIQQAAVPQQQMAFTTKNLKVLNEMRGKALQERTGETILAIKRIDLYRILRQAFLDRGGKLFLGYDVSSVEDSGEGVILNFRQQEPLKVDYLIAADGIGSKMREQLFPDSHIEYQGIRTWLGQSECVDQKTLIQELLVGKTLEVWGVGSRFVMTSLNGTTIHWSALERPETYSANGEPIPDSLQEDLKSIFQDYHPLVQACLDNFKLDQVKRCNFGVVKGLKDYVRGRVVLIGDAAHGMPPNMGQGASLGIEDAFWVAQHLRFNAKPDFAGFFKQRKKKVHQAMSMANGMNIMFQPASQLGANIRDSFFGAIPAVVNERGVCSFYGKKVVKGIQLPDSFRSQLFIGLSALKRLSLQLSHKGYRVTLMKPEHCEAAAKILAQEFKRREPLCKELVIPIEEIQLFFEEMVAYVAKEKLGFVVLNRKDEVVACVTNEDHDRPFEPLKHKPSLKLQWIHQILDRHVIPQEFASAHPGTVVQAGLVAIKQELGRQKILPLLFYESTKALYQKGYRMSYAKITNPAIIKTLLQLDKPVQHRLFKLRSRFWPKHQKISDNFPFLNYDNPVSLVSWPIKSLL